MAGQSLEDRVAALEAQLESKTLDEHFRGIDAKLDARFEPLKRELATIRHAVNVILARRT